MHSASSQSGLGWALQVIVSWQPPPRLCLPNGMEALA